MFYQRVDSLLLENNDGFENNIFLFYNYSLNLISVAIYKKGEE